MPSVPSRRTLSSLGELSLQGIARLLFFSLPTFSEETSLRFYVYDLKSAAHIYTQAPPDPRKTNGEGDVTFLVSELCNLLSRRQHFGEGLISRPAARLAYLSRKTWGADSFKALP